MAETDTHKRAKNQAAGSRGRAEVPLPGGQRLDALSQGGVVARQKSSAAGHAQA